MQKRQDEGAGAGCALVVGRQAPGLCWQKLAVGGARLLTVMSAHASYS